MKQLLFTLLFIIVSIYQSLAQGRTVITEVNYQDSVFKTELKLDSIDFKCFVNFSWKRIASIAYFNGSNFLEGADFYNTQFDSLVDFSPSYFNIVDFSKVKFKKVNFYDARFDNNAYFKQTQFRSSTNFDNTRFDSTVDFSKSHFLDTVTFSNAQFYDNATFLNNQFHKTSNYLNSQFGKIALFKGTIFLEKVNFQDAKFGLFADFSGVNFHDKVDFQKTIFGSTANFYKAVFKGETIFEYSILPNIISFKKARTRYIIDLSLTRLDSAKTECLIDLSYTNISKFKFNYSHNFKLYTSLDTSTYELGLEELDLEKRATEVEAMYEQLMQMQKNYGYNKGYAKADKELQEYLYTTSAQITWEKYAWYNPLRYGLWAWHMGWNLINKFWWDYGYNKTQIFLCSFVIFLMFCTINTLLAWYSKIDSIYQVDSIKPRSKNDITNHNYIYYIKQITLCFYDASIYTGLIFFGIKVDTEKVNYDNHIGAIYLYIQYTIGLVCLAYMTNAIIIGPKIL
ncbi:pentapeptide repeat-containing protein [Sediminitomix flava]|uniref:Pentapeptide repeat protein n=1 Tax=Sediminitomix flava TaxID=379075 RepID=A0A315ZCV4_SEDFL|nr:pentapeptide repeat-containing protein [Sediminitomix flava]PWJ42658.1 pentapeptide repeat protein [Sediminitomix flava]